MTLHYVILLLLRNLSLKRFGKKASVIVSSVVVLCGSFNFIRQFILTAHRMGMTNGDYVYITLNQIPPDNLKTFWSNNDSADAEARLAFASVLQVS